MINTAKTVVEALINASNEFFAFAGCHSTCGAKETQISEMLNTFIVYSKEKIANDMPIVEENVIHLCQCTKVSIDTIDLYAKYSGYNIAWGAGVRNYATLHMRST